MSLTDIQLIKPDIGFPKNVVVYSTTRLGGTSCGDYDSLNLGDHVGDDPKAVSFNREQLPHSTKIQWMKQVHGNVALNTSNVKADIPECDALVSDAAGTLCAVMTADCLPVLVASKDGSKVAAIHAGWKGLANGVIESALNHFSIDPQSLIAWIGPSISQKHYEVDNSIATVFQSYNAVVKSPNKGRYLLDLQKIACQQLSSYGVALIGKSNLCTYENSNLLFSHRRCTHQNKTATGRQASVIGIL